MSEINNSSLLEQLNQRFPGAILKSEEPYGFLTIDVERDNVLPVLQYLKEDPITEMNFLTDICGIHYPEQAGREIGVIYHVHSLVHNVRLRVKTFFSIEDPQIPTATTLYSAANWMERETYDFFGVIFTGHPDLRRILNMDDMDYFPLRKEFRLEDGTRIDKDDRFFGRDGHTGVDFNKRVDRM